MVRDLSFEVHRGELLGFLGPNGAGKTTTMRMILDIIRPDRGRISVFGGLPGVEHQQRVGYLPEDRGLYRDVPIIDTLTYFGALRGMSTSASRARARELLGEVGLGDSMTKKGAELSRGMHQKAQLIATIMNEPELLIVDEPFQGLDPVNAELLKGVLLAQRDRGAAVVMSTHDMGDAQTLCDRILLIDDGQRVLYGTVPVVRQAFSDGAVEVVGRDIPTDPGRFQSVSHVSRSGRFRALPVARRAHRRMTCSGSSRRPTRPWSGSRSMRPTSARSSSAPWPATSAPRASHESTDRLVPAADRGARTECSFLRLVGIVARRDYVRTVKRRGFIVGTLLLPLGLMALFGLSALLSPSSGTGSTATGDTRIVIVNDSSVDLRSVATAPAVIAA